MEAILSHGERIPLLGRAFLTLSANLLTFNCVIGYSAAAVPPHAVGTYKVREEDAIHQVTDCALSCGYRLIGNHVLEQCNLILNSTI